MQKRMRERTGLKNYVLTVFERTGKTLLDETFSAQDDEQAKEIGLTRLSEEGYEAYTHRCVSPDGRLILFHR